mgnify:FL=1
MKRCGDGAHVEFLESFLEGSVEIFNVTFADNRFVDVRGCGAARSGGDPCAHVCTNISCILSHVSPHLFERAGVCGGKRCGGK